VRTLYAAKGGSSGTSDLYSINPANGNSTVIGTIPWAMTGLAFDPTTNMLYGATSALSTNFSTYLITLDPVTGDGTTIGSFSAYGINPGQIVPDLAFSGGDLYGIWTLSQDLILIDKATGDFIEVGDATNSLQGDSTTGWGLDFDNDGVLWVFPKKDDGDYYVADFSQEFTPAGTLDGTRTQPINSASYNSDDGLMWVIINASPQKLATIDLATGEVTEIGTIGNGSLFDALAWDTGVGEYLYDRYVH
jgi:DNA-binding beta-propeller fold protein YncE